MNYVNLTGQDIKLLLPYEKYLELPRDEKYITYTFTELTTIDDSGVITTNRTYKFNNIPEIKTDTIYIVDSIVKRYYMYRTDFAVVNNRILDENNKYLFDNGIRFDK